MKKYLNHQIILTTLACGIWAGVANGYCIGNVEVNDYRTDTPKIVATLSLDSSEDYKAAANIFAARVRSDFNYYFKARLENDSGLQPKSAPIIEIASSSSVNKVTIRALSAKEASEDEVLFSGDFIRHYARSGVMEITNQN